MTSNEGVDHAIRANDRRAFDDRLARCGAQGGGGVAEVAIGQAVRGARGAREDQRGR
jgi:hypothetical protein